MSYDFEANKDKLFDKFHKPIVTGLFKELADVRVGDKFVLFTLKEWKETFLAHRDPTGYKAAIELIGSWKHWQTMLRNPRFRETVQEWEQELDVLLEAEAIQHLRTQATNGNTTAAKFLAKKEYKEDATNVLKNNRGRPKKETPKDIADAIADETHATITADMERLGLKVIGGGK